MIKAKEAKEIALSVIELKTEKCLNLIEKEIKSAASKGEVFVSVDLFNIIGSEKTLQKKVIDRCVKNIRLFGYGSDQDITSFKIKVYW